MRRCLGAAAVAGLRPAWWVPGGAARAGMVRLASGGNAKVRLEVCRLQGEGFSIGWAPWGGSRMAGSFSLKAGPHRAPIVVSRRSSRLPQTVVSCRASLASCRD